MQTSFHYMCGTVIVDSLHVRGSIVGQLWDGQVQTAVQICCAVFWVNFLKFSRGFATCLDEFRCFRRCF